MCIRDRRDTHPKIDALFFAAAGVYGGCKAVMESGRHPKIITFDEVPTTLEMLHKGVISATISQQPHRQGSRSLDLLFEYITSGTLDVYKRQLLNTRFSIAHLSPLFQSKYPFTPSISPSASLDKASSL